MTRLARILLLSLLVCGATARAAPSNASSPSDYDHLVDAVVAQYHLPGIAVGVIDDGKIVYAHTAGDVEPGKPIDTDTLFEIASNSKSMTSTLLARLVEEGKLRWDDPVTKYLPSFRMYDPWVTANMQVGDLLVHHSGLPEGGGDLMLWPEPNEFTPQDVVHGLRYLKPAYSFRAGYGYDNTLYIVAGQVAAAAGGAPYATLMRREVFQPLGMRRCQIGTWNRDQVGNVARPHLWEDGRFVEPPLTGPMVLAATMDAAGGVRCSLNDMLTWAMNWLTPTAKQLAWLTPEQRRKEWTAYTPMPISARQHAWDGTLFYGYGYGWRIADVDGQMTVSHTGTLSGMYSAVTLLPFRRSGYVFLIDADAENARLVLNEVLTKRFTAPQKARSVASYADELARLDSQKSISRDPDTSARKPATPMDLERQLGVWRDPWFGEVGICAHGGDVFFASRKSPRLAGQVMRVGERYLVHWGSGNSEAWLLFPSQPGDALHMTKVDPEADFSDDYEDLAFTREHACE
ncbi:MAG TPA: serine hydrolase domain-containing protein [Steroidobacteraceae bacterium]|nr:serine hydrolase domain-containing protein [Steroidobacteraceae bacterium]